ncbi:hypothetical protein PoB_003676300 [Plakobranchus ocellatus]|uniref:Uncharacterized protein n=1 Tax=Plakobranchus ocellatus TaxID=259542 RepID=A0AAV4AUM0_9GAST|nr:hypothetical protein PoB_003676300 [Plakobranchus ocellatus]
MEEAHAFKEGKYLDLTKELKKDGFEVKAKFMYSHGGLQPLRDQICSHWLVQSARSIIRLLIRLQKWSTMSKVMISYFYSEHVW